MTFNQVIFEGRDLQGNLGLWVTDGTANGTHELLAAQNVDLVSAEAGTEVMFDAITPVSGGGGPVSLLGFTNGTAAGTSDFPVPGQTGGNPVAPDLSGQGAAALGGGTLFGAASGTTLYLTNGTASGTAEVSAPTLPKPFSFSLVKPLYSLGSRVVFVATDVNQQTKGLVYHLWSSDGTAAGTAPIPTPTAALTGLFPNDLTVIGGKAVFNGNDNIGNIGLWVTDGAAGTSELSVPNLQIIQPSSLMTFGSQAMFFGYDNNLNGSLWLTDGTSAGTTEIFSNSGSNADPSLILDPLVTFGSEALLLGSTTGSTGVSTGSLWVTDGTAVGTTKLATPGIKFVDASANPTPPTNLFSFGNEVLFSAFDSSGKPSLWVTNGTSAGTVELTPAGASSSGLNPTSFARIGSLAVFNGIDSQGDNGLWVTDGTTAGTHELQVTGAAASGLNPTQMKGVTSPFPTITGTLAGQKTSDTANVSLFATVTIADPAPGQTETVTVAASSSTDGSLVNLGTGSYNAATGIYSVSGTTAQVTAALDGLVFVPTIHQVAAGLTVTTEFTIKVLDSAGVAATDGTTTVIATATPLAPLTISGTAAGQAVTDASTVTPFAHVTIVDPNVGPTETVTITLSAPANGTLSNLGGGAYNATTGVWSDMGSPATVTVALDGLVFTPTAHQAAPGQTVTTGFTIGVADAGGVTATDASTTVVATAVAAPLTISGTTSGQGVPDTSTATPFAHVKITDPNAGQTETLKVTLSAPANGSLGNLGGGGYNTTTGVWSDTGSAATVTAALDGLVFTPTAHQVAPGQTVTTSFTVADTDTAGLRVTDSTTSVIATAGGVLPTISGTVAGQATTDQIPITPFPNVSITDPNPNQTETATVTLSSAANGSLANLGSGAAITRPLASTP
jgi:ELWxxDGT repeat protein